MRDARKNNKYKKHLSPEDFSLPISCSKLPFQCVVFWVLGRSASRPTLTSRNSPVAIQEEKSGTIPNAPKGFLESFRAFFICATFGPTQAPGWQEADSPTNLF